MERFHFRMLSVIPAIGDMIKVTYTDDDTLATISDFDGNPISNPFIIDSNTSWGFVINTPSRLYNVTHIDSEAVETVVVTGQSSTDQSGAFTGTEKTNALTAISGFQQLFVDTVDPTGFVDPAGVTVTYDETAKTITLTHPSGSIEYYWRGELKTLASPWVSDVHPTVANRYFLKSTDGTNFAWATDAWAFSDIMVAIAIKDTVLNEWWGLREVHGLMPYTTHEETHDLLGTYRKSGLGPTVGTYVVNTATDAATTPGFDAGVIKDEDLPTTIAASVEGAYTTLRVGASSVATFDTAATFPFRSSGSFILVNTPSTGAEAATVTNRFVNVYEMLLPVCQGTSSQKRRRVMLQPQVAYTSLASAQAEDFRALSLGDLAVASPEYVAYTRITYATSAGDANTGKCRIATGGISYLVGSRASQANVVTGAAPTAENIPTSDGYGEVQNALNNKVDETNGAAVNLGVTNLREKKQTTITGAVTQIDWSLGHVTIDRAGDTNLSGAPPFTNVPAAGDRAFLSIFFKHNGGQRQFFANLTYLKSTLTLAGTSGGWDHIVLWTDDGGTNIYGQVVESK